MSELSVRCTVPIEPPITLAARRDSRYETLAWQLSNGDEVKADLVVPWDEIDRLLTASRTSENWWANVPVKQLKLHLTLANVDQDDIDRLLGKHPTAEWYVGNSKDYQEAAELGERVVTEMFEAANAIIESMRVRMGQFWLQPVERLGSLQHVLFVTNAEWRVASKEEWQTLFASPPAIGIAGVFMGAADQYLQAIDWAEVGEDLRTESFAALGFALIADARRAFNQGQVQLAVIHLNSAMEWGVQAFVEREVAGALPEKTLRTVLKQSHSRFLDDWVLPLIRDREIAISDDEWRGVREIQKLRREAGHPRSGRAALTVDRDNFRRLSAKGRSFLTKLLGPEQLKAPPPPATELSAGTAPQRPGGKATSDNKSAGGSGR